MRLRTWVAGFGLVIASGAASAQTMGNTSLPGANNPLPGANNPLPGANNPLPGVNKPLPGGGTLPGTGTLPGGSLPGTGTLPGSSGYLPGPSGTIRLSAVPVIPASAQQPSPFPLPQASGFPAGVGPSSAAMGPTQSVSGSYGQPPALFPGAAQTSLNPGSFAPQARPQETQLPQPENKFPINVGDISLKRVSSGWQLWVGPRMLRNLGDNEMDARGALQVYRDLRPTEWVTIGGANPVVEYGLFNGKPSLIAGIPSAENPNTPNSQARGSDNGPVPTGAGATQITPIDLRSVRIEAVQGVWCLRDDGNIHLNFGANRAEADQALAAVHRYGFNRVGIVGHPTPVMTYFFAAPDLGQTPPRGPFAQAALQAQIANLHKVGVPVPGLGYVGEMIRFDPKTLALRKEGSDWLIVAGNDVLGRFGPSEWVALDSLHTIQQARFTEFCTVGSSGLTFFLSNGRAPTRAPYNTMVRTFDPNSLRVRQGGNGWTITENNRFLLDCASAEEGEALIRLLKAYQFDELCHLGTTPRTGINFLAKTR